MVIPLKTNATKSAERERAVTFTDGIGIRFLTTKYHEGFLNLHRIAIPNTPAPCPPPKHSVYGTIEAGSYHPATSPHCLKLNSTLTTRIECTIIHRQAFLV